MRLVAGEVEHRDFVLESDEYDSAIIVCVSRGRGDIEIDFEDYWILFELEWLASEEVLP